MSDAFLLVIPPGWVRLDWEFISNNIPSMSSSNVIDYINTGAISNIEVALKEHLVIPNEASITEAKLIDDTYFMVKLG